jgi:hypothetical protein
MNGASGHQREDPGKRTPRIKLDAGWGVLTRHYAWLRAVAGKDDVVALAEIARGEDYYAAGSPGLWRMTG